jgi:ATP-dependent DNA ligase
MHGPFEPKFDGFRYIAHRGPERITLQSRQQLPLGRYFLEIIAALSQPARHRGGARQ